MIDFGLKKYAACFLLIIFGISCSQDAEPLVLNGPQMLAGLQNKVAIDISSNIFPSFHREISDYVSRCINGKPTRVRVAAQPGWYVSVDGSNAHDGNFEVAVTRSSGQSFTITIEESGQKSTHYVRCLPEDFQWWTVDKVGATQSEWYQIMPRSEKPGPKPYPAIFDNNGVPIWWSRLSQGTYSARFLENGNFEYLANSAATQVGLDGSIVRRTEIGLVFDVHDSIHLPNGNFVIVSNHVKSGVDLTAWGLSNNESIVNHVITEIDQSDNIVWTWNTYDNIPISENDEPWEKITNPNNHYDPYHFNSIESTPRGVLVSFRNLNAVFHIERATGAILWKLGGKPRPESLTILNDPMSFGKAICGQHDARMLEDGTITLHENGSQQGRTPRVLRYQLDLDNKTATVIENLFSNLIDPSTCCGSARKLPGGNWVVGWGQNSSMMELTSDGSRLFSIHFGSGDYFYRAVPIPYGKLDRSALRAGMDAQYPIL